MSTIDNLDFVNHERFASDTKDYELFKADLRLDGPQFIETNFIAKQVEVLGGKSLVPSLTKLLDTDLKQTWAHFSSPENFDSQRAINGYVISTLGSPQLQEADIEKLEKKLGEISAEVRALHEKYKKAPSKELEQELTELIRMKKQGLRLLRTLHKGILETHRMVDFIQGRVLQYLQG